MHLADRTGFAPLKPRTPQLLGLFAYDGNALGGALLGAGMALTGACPGTSLVQLAAGLRSGVLVVLGGAAGGLAHVVVAPLLKRGGGAKNREAAAATSGSPCGADETTPLSGSATDKKEDTVQASFRLSANALLLAWEVLCVVVIQLAGRFGGRGEGDGPGLVSPVVGGCLIGAAQAATVVLTRHTIGVSTAYENVAQALLRRASVLTPSVLFAAGILAGSAVVTRMASEAAREAIRAGSAEVSAVAAVVGGFVMVFGARVAGGCTSGHGISGLVTFSWASFVSVAAMFGTGILTAYVLG